jgi:hypothetical protein
MVMVAVPVVVMMAVPAVVMAVPAAPGVRGFENS